MKSFGVGLVASCLLIVHGSTNLPAGLKEASQYPHANTVIQALFHLGAFCEKAISSLKAATFKTNAEAALGVAFVSMKNKPNAIVDLNRTFYPALTETLRDVDPSAASHIGDSPTDVLNFLLDKVTPWAKNMMGVTEVVKMSFKNILFSEHISSTPIFSVMSGQCGGPGKCSLKRAIDLAYQGGTEDLSTIPITRDMVTIKSAIKRMEAKGIRWGKANEKFVRVDTIKLERPILPVLFTPRFKFDFTTGQTLDEVSLNYPETLTVGDLTYHLQVMVNATPDNYHTIVRSDAAGKVWHRMENEQVTRISKRDALNCKTLVYLLFYVRDN